MTYQINIKPDVELPLIKQFIRTASCEIWLFIKPTINEVKKYCIELSYPPTTIKYHIPFKIGINRYSIPYTAYNEEKIKIIKRPKKILKYNYNKIPADLLLCDCNVFPSAKCECRKCKNN